MITEMKFKLDECMDVRLRSFFSEAGYDVQTVLEEALCGQPDTKIYSVCIEEKRILITQDMHFSNPSRFSPIPSQGIIVLRNTSQLIKDAEYLVSNLILKLRTESPREHLWIVDHHKIRIWPGG